MSPMFAPAGVFEVEGDDGVEEMTMAPQEQLRHRLKQLTDAVISQSTETRSKYHSLQAYRLLAEISHYLQTS